MSVGVALPCRLVAKKATFFGAVHPFSSAVISNCVRYTSHVDVPSYLGARCRMMLLPPLRRLLVVVSAQQVRQPYCPSALLPILSHTSAKPTFRRKCVTLRLDGTRAAGFDRWVCSVVSMDGWLTNKSTTVLTPFIIYCRLIN